MKVPAKRVPDVVRKAIEFYESERVNGEEFKNFVSRVGASEFQRVFSKFTEVGELNRDTIDTYIDWDKTAKYILECGEGECAI